MLEHPDTPLEQGRLIPLAHHQILAPLGPDLRSQATLRQPGIQGGDRASEIPACQQARGSRNLVRVLGYRELAEHPALMAHQPQQMNLPAMSAGSPEHLPVERLPLPPPRIRRCGRRYEVRQVCFQRIQVHLT